MSMTDSADAIQESNLDDVNESPAMINVGSSNNFKQRVDGIFLFETCEGLVIHPRHGKE